MKRMDVFCSSPSSTAICSSLDHRSMVRHGTTRPINHRHNYSEPFVGCSSSSQLPINPKHNHFDQKSRKSTKQLDFCRADGYSVNKNKQHHRFLCRKSSADDHTSNPHIQTESSRYLLSDRVACIDWISKSDASVVHPDENRHLKARHASSNDIAAEIDSASSPVTSLTSSKSLKSSSSARSGDEVVDLWVSIHCKGCEGKVRKHISKMEGVTSFRIDLATKKVTVIGKVTPLGVLASLSKVKNAQLWPYPSSSTPSDGPLDQDF